MSEVSDMTEKTGRIMRLFEVKVRPGCAETLLEKFASTSADVVKNEPGNLGFFFGRGAAGDEETVIFASFWKDFDAIKARFGADWQKSFLPPGYEDYIEECSIRHLDLSEGWQIRS